MWWDKNSIVLRVTAVVTSFIFFFSLVFIFIYYFFIQENFVRERNQLISEQVQIILNSSEYSRFSSKYREVTQRIYNLKFVEEVYLVGDDCAILNSIPFHQVNICQRDDVIKVGFDDITSELKEVFIKPVKMSDYRLGLFGKTMGAIFIYTLLIVVMIYLVLRKWFLESILNSVKSLAERFVSKKDVDDDIPSELGGLEKVLKSIEYENMNLQKNITKNISDKKVMEVARRIVHDLESPLVTLEMSLTEIRKKFGENDEIELLDLAMQRIKGISSDLSEESKLKVTVCLDVLVSQIVREKQFENKHNERIDIDFESKIQAPHALVYLQEQVLRRILSNLINNSLEASERPVVRITLEMLDKDFCLTIQDNGEGIPPQIIEKIYQGTEVSSKAFGHGIGLSSAYKFINEEVGGEFKIMSSGEGTCISMNIPVATDTAPFIQKINFSRFNEVSILEDNSFFMEMWKKRTDSFNHIRYYDDCFEKIELKDKEQSLIISDYHLAGEDGLMRLSRFKKAHKILCTGAPLTTELIRRCLESNISLIHKSNFSKITLK